MIGRLLAKLTILFTTGPATDLRADECVRRCLSGIRSASLAHELYCELVRRGVPYERASRIAADAFS